MSPDESKLWADYRTGRSIEARNALIAWFLPFVDNLCWRVFVRLPKFGGLDQPDLVNDCIPALIKLIEEYDPTRGASFKTYSGRRLNGAMMDALRARDWVPRSDRLRQKSDLDHRIVAMFRLHQVRNPIETEDPVEQLDHSFLPPAKRQTTDGDRDRWWLDACRGLVKTDRLILLMYYRLDLTMSQIGANLGISESRVSQRMKLIMTRLRERADIHDLKVVA